MKDILRVALLAVLASACSSIRLGTPDRRAQTEKELLRLAQVMEQFRQATGAYPQDPAQLSGRRADGSAYASDDLLSDEWGRPYRLEPDPSGYRIISAGEDGRFGTQDDVIFSPRKR
jgi:hypothetical protein